MRENEQYLSFILDACKKRRIGWLRQDKKMYLPHSLWCCSTGKIKRRLEKLLPCPTNTVGKSCLKSSQKGKIQWRKKFDEALGNQAQTSIQLRIPARSQQRWSCHSSTRSSSTAGKAEGLTPQRHLTPLPPVHHHQHSYDHMLNWTFYQIQVKACQPIRE